MTDCFSLSLSQGILVEARPQNACMPIDPAPVSPTPSDPNSTTKYIVLIRRYDCNFDIKVNIVFNSINIAQRKKKYVLKIKSL